MSTTRATLRRMVASRLGDFKRVEATADGTTSAFTDVQRLTGGENVYAGRELLIVAAFQTENVGLVRFVPTSSAANRRLTLDPPLPQIVTTGDLGELYRERGRGWGVDEIHDALNDSLTTAQEHASVERLDEIVAPFAQETQTVAIPTGMQDVADVQYLRDDTNTAADLTEWCSIPAARNASAPGWWLLPGRLVQINGPDRVRAHGKTIRLMGYGDPPLLLTETDVTTVPAEWLVHQAAALLLYAGIDREASGERRTRWRDEQALADSRRGLLFTTFRPNTQSVMS